MTAKVPGPPITRTPTGNSLEIGSADRFFIRFGRCYTAEEGDAACWGDGYRTAFILRGFL